MELTKDKNEKCDISKKTPLYIIVSLVLLAVLVLSILTAVTIGSSDISISSVYEVIAYKLFGIGTTNDIVNSPIFDVVWYIRLPRIILAVGVGMGLSVAGIIMQAVVKNPLADPYILGVSSGASLGATSAIMLGIGTMFGNNAVGVSAFIGAFFVSILVLLIANIGGRANSIKLLLAGLALSSLCSAFSSFIVYASNDKDALQKVTFWLMGSLGGATWEQIGIVLPVVFLGTIFFISQSRILNLMLLGDEVSITLGTDLNKYRYLYIIITSIIIGFVVYCSGMIGFVGLIIPHVARMFVGTNHKKLIPITALIGSIFLIWSDVLSRTLINNMEIPIGVLVSMIGAPCFVYLMIKKSYGFGGSE